MWELGFRQVDVMLRVQQLWADPQAVPAFRWWMLCSHRKPCYGRQCAPPPPPGNGHPINQLEGRTPLWSGGGTPLYQWSSPVSGTKTG